MQKRDKIIRNMLRQEVANKSVASSIAFTLFSIFTFIYPFNCVRFKLLIQSTAAVIFFLSIFRYLLCRKLKDGQKINERQWQVLKVFIWLNSFGWALIFNLASFELKLSGIHFIIVTTMMAGFVGASLNTLSYFPFLFVPFQAMLLIPQIGTILYYYFAPEHLNYLPLIVLYLMYFSYQIKQYLEFREENLKRFHYQLDLEKANAELERSKEELIEQTVQLVHVSRLAAIGEMSAGIAHEINNPLTIMKGGAQIIEKSILRESYDTNSILKHSQKIQKAINRVTTIVRGLKNFSNSTADTLPKEIIPLSEIIEDTVHFCDELLVSHNIRLEIENIPECLLKCHPVQISQVLINLIKNAQDVLAEDHIPDQEKWIHMIFFLNDNNLIIKVSNGGEKISNEIAEQVFKPFFSTKPVNSGTGLGLSISQRIMKEHLGDITLDLSEPHTTFVIVHPCL